MFNYIPDSTSKMNLTKELFNNAKKTIRTITNKFNSINNLLTGNSIINNNYLI